MRNMRRKKDTRIDDSRKINDEEEQAIVSDEEAIVGDDTRDDLSCSYRSTSSNSITAFKSRSSTLLVILIAVLGIATSAAFVAIGMSAAMKQIEDEFTRGALDTEFKISDAFEDYVNAAALVHARCRHNFTRRDFRELYEYLDASGLKFKAVQFDPNITHDERETAEAEARAYYAEYYPYIDYQGIRGFNTLNSTTLEPRTEQPFYFPIHYMEPILENEAAIDLDYYSSESRIRAVKALFDNKMPSMTDRLNLVKKGTQSSRCGVDGSFGIVLMHPGVKLDDPTDVWPKDFSSIVVCIPDLIQRSISRQGRSAKIFIHDQSDPKGTAFLGAALVEKAEENTAPKLEWIPEEPYETLRKSNELVLQKNMTAANRIWTITVIDTEGIWDNSMFFIVMGGVMILFASLFLAVWVRNNVRRTKRFNEMKTQADNEKAALILQNARQATKNEILLNDFIAHEVRNPVAAAMVACNFVQAEINKPEPLQDKDTRQLAREDMNIIDNALKFVNDLLRNMLDMHRAASKQLQVNMVPTDLLHDILEPVGGMLYRRGSKVKMVVECPDNLWVMADPLRLKQVILNLGRNSSKFIEKGFIRLKAEEVDGNVKLYVDDSGSGIPPEKRERLFDKFQESLDLLSQGTGIGLYLCKNLVDLMGGKIYLDNNYNSGIPGHPGTRFVIDMQAASVQPLGLDTLATDINRTVSTTVGMSDDDTIPIELPKRLKVLFVDDDSILRKLFSRSVKRAAPTWNVRQAANGETALALTDTEDFDIIFVDMYMASVEKQLLGTETVTALRNKGVKSILCGLSANDKENEFLEAGADAFMFKPFPCNAYELTQTLCHILYSNEQGTQTKTNRIKSFDTV